MGPIRIARGDMNYFSGKRTNDKTYDYAYPGFLKVNHKSQDNID